MIDTSSTSPVVVGIDGSKHALRAVAWARDEAEDRGTLLRLVYVIDSEARHLDDKTKDARLALHTALVTVEQRGHHVKVVSEILRGDPAAALIEESRSAQLMCLGARGMHDSAPRRRGGTAAAISESGFCPVAVIRRRHPLRRLPSDRRVVAVLDESPVSQGVWDTALDEARQRDVPVLALTSWPVRASPRSATDEGHGLRDEVERHLEDTERGDAEVRVWVLPLPPNATDLLAQVADISQLIIVGKSNPVLITELVGPQGRSHLRKTNCSVMVFRDQRDAPQAPDRRECP